tara:strand:- start:1287 stop:1859 length:573 start_codon:yes stop_codon:yes gene_type:complete
MIIVGYKLATYLIMKTMKVLGIGSRILHADFGKGVVTNVSSIQYWVTFMDKGLETIEIDADFEVIEAVNNEVDTVSFFDVESSLVAILQKWSDATQRVAIADKWKGGNLVLEPGEAGMSNKEIPINTFFHKIVMVRDRIRVMEQKINASKNLDDQEKVDLQQYITRIYGSLTTFNVLFKNKSDHFVGEKS